jgi:hypothetical protein
VDVLDALLRNLIASTSGFQVVGVSSETPLSLEQLHDSQRGGMIENGGVEIRGYEAGLFSCVLSSIQDISFSYLREITAS